MVRLDLCLDHNRGVVSVCSTERGGRGGGGIRVYGSEEMQRGRDGSVYH